MARYPLLLVAAAIGGASPALAADRDEARQSLRSGAELFFDRNPRAARIELLNAIKADPSWALPHALQGRIYLELGDGGGAQAELDRARGAGMPEDSLAHLLAHAYLLQGSPDQALAEAAKASGPPITLAYAARIAARAEIALGEMDRAGAALDRAAQLAPNSSLVWSDIGHFRMMMGNIGGALEAAQRASALDPDNLEAIMLTGQLVRGQYGLMAAIPWLEKALEIDPTNVTVMGEMAATLGDVGRARDMLAMTRKILAIDPGNARAFYLQAVLAARAGNTSLARSLVYRVRGDMDDVPGMLMLQAVLDLQGGSAEQAAAKLEQLVARQPGNLTARRLLGTALWRSGDGASAIAALEPLARRGDADGYTLSVIGRAYEEGGNRDAASFFLDRASSPVRADPETFATTGNGIMLGASTGNPDDADVAIPRIARMIAGGQAGPALAEAERLRDRNRGAPATHVLVGDVLMALGRPADAANAYREAANIEFSEEIAMRMIAALQRSGQGGAALRVLDLFLSQNPRSVPGLLLAADHFMTVGRWEQAAAVLEGLRLRLGNRNATILANLGWAWFNRGEPGKAVRYAKAAYAVAPSNAAVASGYGWILYKSGTDKAGGAALLKKAVGIAPDQPGFRFQLAQALAGLGHKAAAKVQLQAVLAVPNFPDRQKAAALLAGL